MEKFAMGLLLGGVCGAVLTANNYKMRTLVRKGQEEVQQKFDDMLDQKIEMFEAREGAAATPAENDDTAKKTTKRRKK
ncbi:MAG: hypothetical protein IJX88_02765 [Clostridia bacterium]|nr:hypothetical protein [Clostridia bacterium]